MSTVPLGGVARSVYLDGVGDLISTFYAVATRGLRVSAMRALALLLLLCVAAPILGETGHHLPERTVASLQALPAATDDPASSHENTCLECPQHAWDRGRGAPAGVLEGRTAAGRVTYALADDEIRSSVVGDITEPPRV